MKYTQHFVGAEIPYIQHGSSSMAPIIQTNTVNVTATHIGRYLFVFFTTEDQHAHPADDS
jgi:hypothetical protein